MNNQTKSDIIIYKNINGEIKLDVLHVIVQKEGIRWINS